MTKRIYLAGPMRGIPQFNMPAFDAARDMLRSAGHEVFCPAEQNRLCYGADYGVYNIEGVDAIEEEARGFDLRKQLAADLQYICLSADAVALLPGWENSRGATAERATALALGLEIILL